MRAGIDADIVMKVHSLPEDHEECEGTEALAWCAAASSSRTDREIVNVQDYFLGLTWRKLKDCGKLWVPHTALVTTRWALLIWRGFPI